MNMIEKVARAIFLANASPDGKPVPVATIQAWENSIPAREASYRAAKAAIEAMRKVTDDMISAGGLEYRFGDDGCTAIWDRMIDAALSESISDHMTEADINRMLP